MEKSSKEPGTIGKPITGHVALSKVQNLKNPMHSRFPTSGLRSGLNQSSPNVPGRHRFMRPMLSIALIGASVAPARAIDVYIGSAYDTKLQQLANNPQDWPYTAARVGLWIHPANKNTAASTALVTTIAGHLTNKWAVIERNKLPTEADIVDRINWTKNVVGLNQRVFFYFNGSEVSGLPDNFQGAEIFAQRAQFARDNGATGSWMGVAPHVVLRNDGWSSPCFDLARQYAPAWEGFAYDCQQDTYEFDADFRQAFYDASLTASSNGKHNVPLLSTHRTTDDAFLGGQHEIRDLRNKPNTNVDVIGIEDYTNNSEIPFTPETLPDGSCARTVTGLARWIYLYYGGTLTVTSASSGPAALYEAKVYGD
jgi:hypothetical protein